MSAQQSQGTTAMIQGRIVWVNGNLFKGRGKTEYNSNKPMLDDSGHQIIEYGFGLAVPKDKISNNPEEFWVKMHTEALSLYPSGQLPPDFAMKFKDGDTGVGKNGQPLNTRTGYAGHIVLACITRIPIKWFKFENNQNFQTPDGIKCGDYVNVQLIIRAQASGKPGLYLNPSFVQQIGFGEEIVNTPSGDQIFGTGQPAMPQGASAIPVAPAGMIAPPSAMQGPAALPVATPAPTAAAIPNYAVLPPNHQPVAQQAPVAPPTMPPQQPVVPGFSQAQQAAPVVMPPSVMPGQPVNHYVIPQGGVMPGTPTPPIPPSVMMPGIKQ